MERIENINMHKSERSTEGTASGSTENFKAFKWKATAFSTLYNPFFLFLYFLGGTFQFKFSCDCL